MGLQKEPFFKIYWRSLTGSQNTIVILTENFMSRGGARIGAGKKKKYSDPCEIRICLDRQERDRLDSWLEKQGISDRNNWLRTLIEAAIEGGK